MKLHVTNGCGKMKGLNSISTSSLCNSFCQKMKENPSTICRMCYANKYEKMRPSLEKCLINNSAMLSEKPLADTEIPVIMEFYFRFNGFGEIINDTHYLNLCAIAKKNPRTTFALWTKRPDIVMKYKKVKNIVYIYSNPFIDKNFSDKKIVKWFDHIFSVFNKKFAAENGIALNCTGKQCAACLVCYKKDTEKMVNEKRK